ncbi:acyl carrier protein [Limibacillus sp. MBR-115]|jgi:acyl carrier protein
MDRTLDKKIFGIILEILTEFNPDGRDIAPGTKLNEDLNLDSVTAMDLVMEIEDRFEIDIPMNMVGEVETVSDLVAVVEDRMAGGK